MSKGGSLFPDLEQQEETASPARKKRGGNGDGWEPPNLGKAIRMAVPDFNDPNRPLTCLEVDFPLARINALAIPESTSPGVRRRPEYSAMKWFARRGQSVFRSILIAAGSSAPDKSTHAARTVWDAFYANHLAAGSFRKLKVLDPFMGGGTTLVEAVRLGFQITGIDLNPVAWLVCKNELACSDPELVQKLFDEIEAEVKPQIQPFYTTTCPRGHRGRWIDTETGKAVDVDPLTIPPEQRKRYRWDGPDALFTFWVKHGPCKIPGCGHRTPILAAHVVAQKSLSRFFVSATCPSCKTRFNIELGETRMAPSVDRIVLDSELLFTETSQAFAQLLKDYDKGNSRATAQRTEDLLDNLDAEQALCCPTCGSFAADEIKMVLQRHQRAQRAVDVKKKHFGIKRSKVQMWLLIHPDWLEGASGFIDDKQTREYGGYAGAPVDDTVAWYEKRLESLALIEVRGDILPEELELPDGAKVNPNVGTVPGKSKFRCMACGPEQDILESVKPTRHTAPVAAYMLQCHCPQCDTEGYNYNGRYFKAVDATDVANLSQAEREWDDRKDADLSPYWPREECEDAYMMRANGGVNDGWGYTHWWKMWFSSQLVA